jgi:hypothetical protein
MEMYTMNNKEDLSDKSFRRTIRNDNTSVTYNSNISLADFIKDFFRPRVKKKPC